MKHRDYILASISIKSEDASVYHGVLPVEEVCCLGFKHETSRYAVSYDRLDKSISFDDALALLAKGIDVLQPTLAEMTEIMVEIRIGISNERREMAYHFPPDILARFARASAYIAIDFYNDVPDSAE